MPNIQTGNKRSSEDVHFSPHSNTNAQLPYVYAPFQQVISYISNKCWSCMGYPQTSVKTTSTHQLYSFLARASWTAKCSHVVVVEAPPPAKTVCSSNYCTTGVLNWHPLPTVTSWSRDGAAFTLTKQRCFSWQSGVLSFFAVLFFWWLWTETQPTQHSSLPNPANRSITKFREQNTAHFQTVTPLL